MITLASRAHDDDDIIHWLTRGIAQRADLHVLAMTTRDVPTLRRRRILDLLAELEPGIESVLEQRYLVLVERAHGLPPAKRQVDAVGERLDGLYPDWGVVIELDGRLGHTGDAVFRDLRRDNRNAPPFPPGTGHHHSGGRPRSGTRQRPSEPPQNSTPPATDG